MGCLPMRKFACWQASAWLNLENHARWGCVCDILCENLPEGQEKLPTGKLVLAWLHEKLPAGKLVLAWLHEKLPAGKLVLAWLHENLPAGKLVLAWLHEKLPAGKLVLAWLHEKLPAGKLVLAWLHEKLPAGILVLAWLHEKLPVGKFQPKIAFYDTDAIQTFWNCSHSIGLGYKKYQNQQKIDKNV